MMATTSIEDVQTYWQVPLICHFFHRFEAHLESRPFYFQDLEAALIDPDYFWNPNGGRLVDDIVFTLVRCYHDNNLPDSDFAAAFCEMITTELVENDKQPNPLVQKTLDDKTGQLIDKWIDINDLPIPKKVELIEKMVNYVVCNRPSFFSKYECKKLRLKPIGKDSKGFVYWYFHGNRLYRQRTRVIKVAVKRLEDIEKEKKVIESLQGTKTFSKPRSSIKDASKEISKSLKKSLASPVKPTKSLKSASKSKNIPTAPETLKTPKTPSKTLESKKRKSSAKEGIVKAPTAVTSEGHEHLALPAKKELWTVICETPQEWENLFKILAKSTSSVDTDLASKLLRYIPVVREAYDEKELAIPKREKLKSLRKRRNEIYEMRLKEHMELMTSTRLRSSRAPVNYTDKGSDEESLLDENQAPVTDDDDTGSEAGSKANADDGKEPKKGKKFSYGIKYKKRVAHPKYLQTYHEKALLARTLRERRLRNDEESTGNPAIAGIENLAARLVSTMSF